MNLNELYKKLREADSSNLDFTDRYFKLGILATYITFTNLNNLDFYKDIYMDKKLILADLFRLETEEVEVKQEIGFLKEAFKGEEFVQYGGMVELGYLMALGTLCFHKENEAKKSRSYS